MTKPARLTRILALTAAPALAVSLSVLATSAVAQAPVLNLYSSRHYQTDEALYTNFTQQTGIKINRIEAGEDALLERMKNEGDKSPADVLLTVDAGRLWRAEQMGLLQPIKSEVLLTRIDPSLRHPEGLWFSFSIRARPIFYNKASVNRDDIQTYEDLASPKLKGKVCARSGAHMYNLSLMSAMIAAVGPVKAEEWGRGVVANFARAPKGGDTDQIKAVAAGECAVAIANSYYYARLANSSKGEDKDVAGKVGVVFPNQKDRGTHVNVSGAGVAKHAPNKAAAIKFLEYLASDSAQRYFANGNNEYPVVGKPDNAALKALGDYKRDPLNVGMYGKNQAAAQQIMDRVGWK
ncbi:MAG: Fe(3+) ABC transporter substrate-binding protein [Burkholderiales bacterium]|nr:Fe(3+) ABC transporter substrate-binding protein [Burkholderiales bacterium]